MSLNSARSRRFLAAFVTAIALLASLVGASAAESGVRKPFDLPAGPAAETLRRFIAQSGVQLLYAPDEVAGVRTNAVKGNLTADEAVDQLVSNTGLAAVHTRSGAIAINRAPSPNVARATPAAPNANDQPAIELSPFVINERASTGWVATETLAGTRLRTDLKDVPNQIETLTMDFMADLGVTDMNQALIYTANVENANDYMRATPGQQVINPEMGGRVRGIGSGTLSRNFFQASNPTDNFNLERATVASGPNAILFGLGSGAGILDATPAQALLNRNKYGFTLQYDSEDSKRATIDANVVVLKDKLAVRVMGLSKTEYTDKQPNDDRDDRVYAAVTFKPFKNTKLILEGEKDNRSWNIASRVAPVDAVTPWLNANRIPNSGYAVASPGFDNRGTVTIPASNLIFGQAAQNPVLIENGSVPIMNWRNSAVVKAPTTLPGVDATFDASVDRSILDPNIFPLDVNIVGESRTNHMGGNTKTVMLEQRLARNLFVEVAYNYEKYFSKRIYAGGQQPSNNAVLRIDPNQFLPGTTTPNPNFGKFYTQGTSSNNLRFQTNEDMRANASYEFDFDRDLSRGPAWVKRLGRHRLSGMFTTSTQQALDSQDNNRRILDDPVITGLTLTPKTTAGWANNATRTPQVRHYFNTPHDPFRTAFSMEGDVTLIDANGQPYRLYNYDTPLRATDGKRLGPSSPVSGSLNKTSGLVFAWQGFFLPDSERRDRLVLTYGYRKDKGKSATLDAASTTADFSGLYPVVWDTKFANYGAPQDGINRNIGVVVRPLHWLSLFYNRSDTFDLNIGNYDPFGNDIPGAGGSGKDYGIRFDLWKDKVSLRLNKYENSVGPQRTANQIGMFRQLFFNVESRALQLDPNLPTINTKDGNLRGFRVAGNPNYQIMSDSTSEGYELELNLTPVPNWNIRINGAKSESVESNIGGPWFAWGAARLPVWESVVAKNGERDAGGNPATWATAAFDPLNPSGQTLQQYYQSTIVGRAFAFMSAAEGRATDTARSGRANVITNYHFTGERLKGFNIGGAARWRGRPTIGYGTSVSSSGSVILDLDKRYKGEEEFYLDGFMGYRGKIKYFGGFNYRLQLNVRNVLDEDNPVPVQSWTTGEVVRLATVEPRVFVLSLAVDF